MKSLCALLLTFLLAVAAEEGPALQEFTIGNNLFTASVYRELLKENDGNFLVSPFSAETVLALTQAGAKDDTAAEIRTSLRLPNTTEKITTAYQELLPTFKGNDLYALKTANKLYVENNLKINDDFLKIATSVYQASSENVAFESPATAAAAINQWVEEQTENKIQNLIDPSSLDASTKLVLVNALYFKGKWVHQFDPYTTTKQDFYISARDAIKVDAMSDIDDYNYFESKELNAKFLELPYQGGDVSMVIVLPNERDGLRTLESNIDQLFIAPKFNRQRVRVLLPKFTIETKINLKPILQALGIKRAFTTLADLSGIAGVPGDLFIGEVVQKAFINVTESGTEAAAATGVIIVPASATVYLDEPKHFNADHGFLFYIKIKDTILFSGRVSNPNK